MTASPDALTTPTRRVTQWAPVTERRSVDPRRDPDWAALMKGPRGSLFGSPPWIAAVADTYGFDPTADVLVGDDAPVAGMACMKICDLRGARIVSLPFSDHCDPVVDEDEQWERLVAPMLASGVPVNLRVMDADLPLRDTRFVRTDELLWHATDLQRPESEVLAGLHAQVRQHMRGATRKGVTVRFGSELDDVRAFHALHRGTRKRKYGLLAPPVSFFERIWECFAPLDQVVVGLASHDGEVIAGALYLFWNDTIYYKFGASIPERLSLRPNELLGWESVKLAHQRGCHRYDWGVSDLDQPGLVAYKRKYATEERRVIALRHTPIGFDDPVAADAGRVLGELTSLLTRDDVPDEVTQRAGEILYRFFC
jgi:CelD/BcsL family acetyltransferase involved in cellulose biosynthesis